MKLCVDIEKRLDNFNLDISFETDNEVFAILGASGCGKSMTLKCIAGIEKPDRGFIKLGDHVLFDSEAGIDLPPRKRRVGYLFQDYALFPNMTVRENIECGSREKADEMIRRFYLSGKEHLKPAMLSGGEKQRTAIARMLAASPDLIMLDEPLSAMDSFLRNNLQWEIKKAADSMGGQAILVSHDRDEIFSLTDTIAAMDNGNITCIQNKRDLFSNPQSLAAAMLSGCENFTAVRERCDGTLWAEEWGITLTTKRDKDIQDPAFACFRAEDFLIIGDDLPDEMFTDNVPYTMLCRPKMWTEDTKGTLIRFDSPSGNVMTLRVPAEKGGKILKDKFAKLYMPPERVMFLRK